jgi:hypothetical protein
MFFEKKSDCVTWVLERITDEEIFGFFSMEIYTKTAKTLL